MGKKNENKNKLLSQLSDDILRIILMEFINSTLLHVPKRRRRPANRCRQNAKNKC